MAADVTLLLRAHRDGEEGALEELARLVYPDLKAMARRRAGAGGLGATTLVNESFLRLLSGGAVQPEDRSQFFALMATIMRRLIVDEVRYVTADKRRAEEVTLADGVAATSGDDVEFLILVDRVLHALEAEDERLVRVFEARYFAGLSVEETAQAFDLSARTVDRLWATARERVAALISDSST